MAKEPKERTRAKRHSVAVGGAFPDLHMTLPEACAYIGIGDRRFHDMAREGWFKKEADGNWSLYGIVQGYQSFLKSQTKQVREQTGKATLEKMRSKQVELRMAKDEKELVPVDLAVALVQVAVGETMARLDSLPARCTRDLDERDAIKEQVDAIRKEVAEFVAKSVHDLQTGDDTSFAEPEDDPGPVGGEEPGLSGE